MDFQILCVAVSMVRRITNENQHGHLHPLKEEETSLIVLLLQPLLFSIEVSHGKDCQVSVALSDDEMFDWLCFSFCRLNHLLPASYDHISPYGGPGSIMIALL